MLSLDRCRAVLNADPDALPYTDDEIRAVRDFLHRLARLELTTRPTNALGPPDPASAPVARPDAAPP